MGHATTDMIDDARCMAEEIGIARHEILRTRMAAYEMRIRYWMNGAFLAVVGIGAVATLLHTCLQATGRARAVVDVDPMLPAAGALCALAATAMLIMPRMTMIDMLLRAVRDEERKLTAATAAAETELDETLRTCSPAR